MFANGGIPFEHLKWRTPSCNIVCFNWKGHMATNVSSRCRSLALRRHLMKNCNDIWTVYRVYKTAKVNQMLLHPRSGTPRSPQNALLTSQLSPVDVKTFLMKFYKEKRTSWSLCTQRNIRDLHCQMSKNRASLFEIEKPIHWSMLRRRWHIVE